MGVAGGSLGKVGFDRKAAVNEVAAAIKIRI
jgi:hypothetical protein